MGQLQEVQDTPPISSRGTPTECQNASLDRSGKASLNMRTAWITRRTHPRRRDRRAAPRRLPARRRYYRHAV
ncbi:hypothetical protein G6F22_020611 [Rhizopus arrhizus]|nr:hypothetical protein G6F22_020611 [Rhizopus arrhizus]KAG0920085.1 hypothetical protein G6F31_020875 [Rhizopus arrhizus]